MDLAQYLIQTGQKMLIFDLQVCINYLAYVCKPTRLRYLNDSLQYPAHGLSPWNKKIIKFEMHIYPGTGFKSL